jgi:hypothetical protein
MRAKYSFLYLIAILFVAGCTRGGYGLNIGGSSGSGYSSSNNSPDLANEKLSPVNYVKWVEDAQNGLNKEKQIGEMIYSAQYKPYNYVICEQERQPTIADSTVRKDMSQLGNMQYFNLKISLGGGQGELLKYNLSSREEYDGRVNYFAFGMQKDIELVDGSDTLPCLLYHYERIYDVAPSATFLLGFAPGKSSKSDRTLILFDKGFKKGIIKFYFEAKAINILPQLQTI